MNQKKYNEKKFYTILIKTFKDLSSKKVDLINFDIIIQIKKNLSKYYKE